MGGGKIVSITDYGAFIELEPGVEGLIHISEMSWPKKVRHPSKIVQMGDEVEALVKDLDIERKRISLSMKEAEPNPWNVIPSEVLFTEKLGISRTLVSSSDLMKALMV